MEAPGGAFAEDLEGVVAKWRRSPYRGGWCRPVAARAQNGPDCIIPCPEIVADHGVEEPRRRTRRRGARASLNDRRTVSRATPSGRASGEERARRTCPA